MRSKVTAPGGGRLDASNVPDHDANHGVPRLTRQAAIAALVPSVGGEAWLEDCVWSLVQQTHPLDAIVIVDDGSPDPPIEIARRHPQVTLLATAAPLGIHRLLQQLIDDTEYAGYLLQGPGGWSSRDRLAALVDEAERTGAELVGSQEVLICRDTADARPSSYPLDVNSALNERPHDPHAALDAILISRDLVQRIGRLPGEGRAEMQQFLQDAAGAASLRNIPHHCYFRRAWMNPAALTSRDVTDGAGVGLNAPHTRPHGLAARPTPLTHVSGPKLKPNRREPRLQRPRVASSRPAEVSAALGAGL